MKRIGIITPGGDAPGMNACLRSLVRIGVNSGYELYGIKRGYSGLLEEDIIRLDSRSVSGIINRGGTILKSARCKEIRNEKGIIKAGKILKKKGIDWLVVIGGDGSLTAGTLISKKCGIPMTGIPASIDNDVNGTDETIGFDTAIDTAIEAVDKIRDTATSFDRIFVIEVMGREHGFLAINVAAATGAEFVVLPERKYNLNDICRELMHDKSHGKNSGIIIFAEGAGDSRLFAQEIQKRTGLEVRVSSLGYIQRGGSPSARSRILGAQFAMQAIKLINRGLRNRLVVLKGGKICDVPLRKTAGTEKSFDLAMYKLIKLSSK
jgi:6-phosphofructokinase 1